MPTWRTNPLKFNRNKQYFNWKKNHVFRHSLIKIVRGSYGKSETAIFFLKVWSNIVEKLDAIAQYSVDEIFVWKKKRFWKSSVYFIVKFLHLKIWRVTLPLAECFYAFSRVRSVIESGSSIEEQSSLPGTGMANVLWKKICLKFLIYHVKAMLPFFSIHYTWTLI